MADAVEKRHRAEAEQSGKETCEKCVTAPEAFCRLADSRTDFVVSDTCHLGIKHLHTAGGVQHRDYGEGEKNDSHTAEPLDKAAIEKHCFCQSRQVVKCGATGGGEAGHGFKKGIVDCQPSRLPISVVPEGRNKFISSPEMNVTPPPMAKGTISLFSS